MTFTAKLVVAQTTSHIRKVTLDYSIVADGWAQDAIGPVFAAQGLCAHLLQLANWR